MSEIRQKGDKAHYSVKDRDCLGRPCLRLGHYQSRGATLSGSRNTGDSSPCCMTRAYHGCPTEHPELYELKPELLAERKKAGMKAV